jgi:serine/threonine protein kinase
VGGGRKERRKPPLVHRDIKSPNIMVCEREREDGREKEMEEATAGSSGHKESEYYGTWEEGEGREGEGEGGGRKERRKPPPCGGEREDGEGIWREKEMEEAATGSSGHKESEYYGTWEEGEGREGREVGRRKDGRKLTPVHRDIKSPNIMVRGSEGREGRWGDGRGRRGMERERGEEDGGD